MKNISSSLHTQSSLDAWKFIVGLLFGFWVFLWGLFVCFTNWSHKIYCLCQIYVDTLLLILVDSLSFLFDTLICPHLSQKTPFMCVKSWWSPKHTEKTLQEYFLVIFVFWSIVFSLAYSSWNVINFKLEKKEAVFLVIDVFLHFFVLK